MLYPSVPAGGSVGDDAASTGGWSKNTKRVKDSSLSKIESSLIRMSTGFSSSWGRNSTSGVSRTKSLSSSAAQHHVRGRGRVEVEGRWEGRWEGREGVEVGGDGRGRGGRGGG